MLLWDIPPVAWRTDRLNLDFSGVQSQRPPFSTMVGRSYGAPKWAIRATIFSVFTIYFVHDFHARNDEGLVNDGLI